VKHIRIALCGAPNCGKTTLFNYLTGQTQKTGNWPGVTVARSEGTVRKQLIPAGISCSAQVIDLPGTCSLFPFSPEEGIALHYLQTEAPQVILCVINACAPAQGLSLALQLMSQRLPLVLVFNQIDRLYAIGGRIDMRAVSDTLHLPSVCISARSGDGIQNMLHHAFFAASQTALTQAPVPFDPKASFSRYAQDAKHRYTLIDTLLENSFDPGKSPARQTSRFDKLLMHKYGWPVLLLLFFAVLFCVFGAPGQWLSDNLSRLMQQAIEAISTLLTIAHTPPLWRSLLTNGVFRGLSAVLAFLPTLLLFFMLTALMEDSGLLTRAAFMLDAPLRRLGMSGRSFFPLMTGFGCTVPAVMAARTLPERRERLLTALLTAYLPCGAKIPVFLYLSALAFPRKSFGGILFCYLLGVIFMILVSFLLQRILHAAPSPLLLELPAYRVPSLRGVWRVMREKTFDFLSRACTVVFFTSLIIWFLQYFSPTLTPAMQEQESLLYTLSAFLSPLFAPLGLSSPPLIAALLAGLLAKENILSVLMLFSPVESLFTSTPAILSFMTFAALYAPCLASCAVLAHECKSRAVMLCAVLSQTAVAWLAALAVYRILI